MATRGNLLRGVVAGAAGLVLVALLAHRLPAMGDASKVRLCVLQYEGNWNSRPNALLTLLSEVDQRTSVAVSFDPAVSAPDQDRIFSHPLLWMSGDRAFGPLPERAVENLRRHLRSGGMLVVDDTSGRADSEFSLSLRRELERIFPGQPLEPLPPDHAVFRAFYYVGRAPGLAPVQPHLEGITLDGRAAVVFCANDLSGALDLDEANQWKYSLPPDREEDRILSLRLGVNLVVYALCVNYKLDMVHVLYQMRHPSRYPGAAAPDDGTGAR